VAQRVINGYPDGTFRPDGPVTRAEVIKMVVSAMGYEPFSNGIFPYTDMLDTNGNPLWFAGWVSMAVRRNMIGSQSFSAVWPETVKDNNDNDTRQKLFPDQPANRAEVARVLFNIRYLSHLGQSTGYVPWADFLKGVNLVMGSFVRTVTDARVTESNGHTVQIQRTYNSFGTENRSFGPHWTFNYDLRVKPTDSGATVTLADGRELAFTRQADGRLAPPTGYYERLTRENSLYVLTDRSDMRFGFGADGELASIVDRNGNAVTFTYGATTLDITDADGRTFHFDRDTKGQIAAMTDPAGNPWRYTYDPQTDDLVQVEDPRGGLTAYAYNNHRLDSITGPFDKKLTAEQRALLKPALSLKYDLHDRVHLQFDAAADVPTEFWYDPLMLRSVVVDPNGHNTQVMYDLHLRVLGRIDPLGNFDIFKYDGNNNISDYWDKSRAWEKDQHPTHREYDDRGNVLLETNAEMETTRWQYHPTFNLPTLITDPLGGQTRVDYDPTNGNLLTRTITAPDGTVISVARYGNYDAKGRPRLITDPRSTTQHPIQTSIAYDDAQRTRTETDTLGLVSAITYDALGRKFSETNGERETTQYTYLPADQIHTVTTPVGTTTYVYDLAGHLTGTTDARGVKTDYFFSDRNLLDHVVGPYREVMKNGQPVREGYTEPTYFKYDDAGHVKQKIAPGTHDNPQPQITQYAYDDDGRVDIVTDPTNSERYFHYYPAGNLWWETLPKWARPRDKDWYTTPTGGRFYAYDQVNRLTRIQEHYRVENGETVHDETVITYDKRGRKLTEADPTGVTTQYTYDDAHRQVQVAAGRLGPDGRVVRLADGTGYPTTYEYDADGNLATVTDPRGHVTTYQYDDRNRLAAVTTAAERSDAATTQYRYDLANRRIQQTDPLGNITQYHYDAGGFLDRVREYGKNDPKATNPLRETTYLNDPAGNLRQITDALSHTWKYTYDPANRLLTMTDALGQTVTHQYDQEGNRWQTLDRNGHPIGYHYDPDNRLTDVVADTTSSFAYDVNGNRISMTDARGTTRYDYDTSDRLSSVITPDHRAIAYSYDGANRVLAAQRRRTAKSPS
jgi:YD repeat-containing protein